MRSFLGILVFSLAAVCVAKAEPLSPNSVRGYAQIMKRALEAKDAPAACWLAGMSEGFLKALSYSGNKKATTLWNSIQGAEGKCGGKNSMDLSKTFTAQEWEKLSELQKKLESAEL